MTGHSIRSVDYSALTSPVDRSEVATFKVRARASGAAWAGTSISAIVGFVVLGLIAMVVLGGAAINLVGLVIGVVRDRDSDTDVSAFAAGTIFFLGFLLAVALVARSMIFSRTWETWYRLDAFATANDLVFSPSDPNPNYPGAIFGIGHDRAASNHLRSSEGRFLDLGNYTYVTGSGKNRTTHSWGFMALKLDRSLPHMVLDSRANNGLFGGTNLPSYFSRDQRLELEGDFNEYFTLYCPRQYERDALYVFTPDLMALFIDEAAPCDAEIVDDWLFIYSSRPFASTSPAVYQRLFRIVDTVGAKTLAQTRRYADDRAGGFAVNVVAPQGRRLKRGFSVGAVITIVVFVIVWAWPQVSEVLGVFGP